MQKVFCKTISAMITARGRSQISWCFQEICIFCLFGRHIDNFLVKILARWEMFGGECGWTWRQGTGQQRSDLFRLRDDSRDAEVVAFLLWLCCAGRLLCACLPGSLSWQGHCSYACFSPRKVDLFQSFWHNSWFGLRYPRPFRNRTFRYRW
jgi:hypothetical protein